MASRAYRLLIAGLVIALGGMAGQAVLAQPWGYPGLGPYGPGPYPPLPPGYGPPGYYPAPPYGRSAPSRGADQSQSKRGTGGQGGGDAQAEASVRIHAPEDGARLPAGEPVFLDYSVNPGPRGDHIHLYVDGEEVAIVQQLEGRYSVGELRPGRHELAIKVVNKSHAPIGVESSVAVIVGSEQN